MVNELDRVTLARRMDTLDDVRAFLRDCTLTFGLSFHPDTYGAEYHNSATGVPTFTLAQATAFDANMRRAVVVADRAGRNLYELADEVPEWRALLAESSEDLAVQQSRPAGVDWWPAL